MATLSYQRAILGGHLGEDRRSRPAMIPFLLAAILISLVRAAAAQMAAGRGK